MTTGAWAVLFDLDGVIVDTKEGHYRSFAALADEVGYQIDEDIFRGLFGRQNDDIFPALLGRPVVGDELASLADRKEALFRDMVRGTLRALPGVDAFVRGLVALGARVAVGTSTPRANVDLVLSELGLADVLTTIISAEQTTHGKPHPEVFLKAAAAVGVPPERCLVVEDAVAGVEAARRGGMAALGVTTNHSAAALAAADRVVDSLADITPAEALAIIAAHGAGAADPVQ